MLLTLSLLAMSGRGMAEPAEPPDEPAPTAPVTAVDGQNVYFDGKTPTERASALLTYCATAKPGHDLYAKEAMIYYVARIMRGTDVAYAVSQWQKTAAKTLADVQASPAGKRTPGAHRMDPFDKHVLVWSWILCHDKTTLPPDIEANTKGFVALWHHRVWKGYGALNYRLMMDGAGYLAAEQWPDLVDADGLNADQIKEATKKRLMGYFTDIIAHNHPEYGSPTYLGVDLSAMKMLAEAPRDAELREAAHHALDAMFLQMAAAWNHGYLITPAGRAKYWTPADGCPDSMDAAAACAWVFWGGDRPVNGAHLTAHHSGWFGLPGYTPPPLLDVIAHDRTAPVTNQASVLIGGEALRLTLYQAPTYGVASQWEAKENATNALCKETKREMFKWVSDKPASSFIPLQENLQRPYVASDRLKNAFGYGENPYTQVLQCDGTLIAVSQVAATYPYWKIYAPFTTQGAIVRRIEKGGWVFCHGGSVLFAFRTLKPSTWGKPEHGCDVLWSDDRTNGWVLETSPVAPYAGGGVDAELARFASAVAAKVVVNTDGMAADPPRLQVRNLAGHELALAFRPFGAPYDGQQKIDGKKIDYDGFPLVGTRQYRHEVGDTDPVIPADATAR